MAPQRRKLLQIYSLTGDKLVHLKDFNIPESALLMARDDESVCVALSSSGGEGRYILLNVLEGKVGQLHYE